MDEILEYEMDEQDMDFVNKTLPGMKMTIKEDRFEQIVDRLEKESGKNSGKLAEINVLDTYKLGGGKVVTQVLSPPSVARSWVGMSGSGCFALGMGSGGGVLRSGFASGAGLRLLDEETE
eukprot:771336-Rhodomonas_salina.3